MCVLARRWRHLWKSTARLHIRLGPGHPFDQEPAPVKNFRKFVDHLLLLRAGSPLDTCDITLLGFDKEDMPQINLWIRHVLMCKVRVLRLSIFHDPYVEPLDDLPLVSQHLTKLKLCDLQFNDSFADFSGCPALEDLEIESCYIASADTISSPSIKRLRIHGWCTFGQGFRNRIYAPNLVSLRLEVDFDRVPVLERMPLLVEAAVEISYSEFDTCHDADYGDCGDEFCDNCYEIDGDTNTCVVLQGFSHSRDLQLISHYTKMFIFRRDLKQCPTFTNLKTLLLNEYWCMPADFSALACILEHSPILEKLILQLLSKRAKSKIEMKGRPGPTERSVAISQHLKIVEVICELVDEKVLNLLKFLNKLNIHSFTTDFSFEE
uniref:FBD domain-containing protein n=1 Tax=Arundo donax TaxID=35708 RepID=A0A0A9GV48_ARUDO